MDVHLFSLSLSLSLSLSHTHTHTHHHHHTRHSLSLSLSLTHTYTHTTHTHGTLSLSLSLSPKPEILSRIAQTTCALTKLNTIWKDKNIALSSEIRLIHSLVISIFLYVCETWILTAELEGKIQATEKRCFRRLLLLKRSCHK